VSECIEAQGRCNNSGYVMAYASGFPKGVGAHRLAWIRAHGPIPDGLHVCHKCDNRKCVNVEHLFLGTARDNVRDCRAKGRAYTVETQYKARGERVPHAKLTEGWVRAGRALRELGLTYAEIAAELGVHKMTVYDFCKGRTWTHV